MRLLILSLFLIVQILGPKTCNAQGVGTFQWTNGAPNNNPGLSGAKFAVDKNTYIWYEYIAGTTWAKSGDRIQQITGCAAPAYTPAKHNSNVVINSCTEPEIYFWNGTAWKLLNGGATYTAGTGIAISGGNVISADTSLLATQYDISNLGVTWPLLAPNGTPTAPTYSFIENPTGGLMFEDGSVKIVAGGDEGDLIAGLQIIGANSFADDGGNILIQSGTGGGTGGNLVFNGGLGVSTGGGLQMSGGVSTQGGGGGFTLTGGSGDTGGGNFTAYAGECTGTGNGGNMNFYAGFANNGDGGDFTFLAGESGGGGRGGNMRFAVGDGFPRGEITFQSGASPVFFQSPGIRTDLLTTVNINSLTLQESQLLYNTTTKTYEIYDGSTRYQYGKIIKASATLDFPSTAVNTNSDLTTTVTGAAVGDVVTVAPPLAAISAHSCYTAWVSAANTVTVRFNHYGAGGATNPASGVFNIIVTKF